MRYELAGAVVVLGLALAGQSHPTPTITDTPAPHSERTSIRYGFSPTEPGAVNWVAVGTREQRDLVRWALERYEAAGLELPSLQFDLHADSAACHGHRGLFSTNFVPWRVTLCSADRTVVLHEIGHAWAQRALEADERQRYLESRGLESWNDPETRWSERGFEDAANTLAWGLLPDRIRGTVLPDGPLAERNQAFRLLTGFDSPRASWSNAAAEQPVSAPSPPSETEHREVSAR